MTNEDERKTMFALVCFKSNQQKSTIFSQQQQKKTPTRQTHLKCFQNLDCKKTTENKVQFIMAIY